MAALDKHDVVWVADRERFGREARVAPLSVAGLMRGRVFGEHTTVLTSATLKLGGDFTPIAASVGLKGNERLDALRPAEDPNRTVPASGAGGRRRSLARPRCRLTVRLSPAGHPVHRPIAAAARSGRVCLTPRWPRSPSWSGLPADGHLGCSLPAGPPRPRPCTPASSCRS